MFQKKDYIYSEAMGVCRVADITNLSIKKGNPIPYYVLRSVYQKDKVAYIPVENHSVELRALISLDEATERISYREESQEQLSLEEQYKMADFLSLKERESLFLQGEAEFVIRYAAIDKKNEKKKKANTETVTE